ncbi:MAG: preprotein translocase subunit SecD [Methanocella sp.]
MVEKKGEQSTLARILFDYRVMILLGVLLLAAVFLFVYPSPTGGNLTNLKFGLDFEGGSQIKLMLVNNSTIPEDQLQLTKDIMANRINNFGLQDVPINTVRDDKQNAYILIDFAGLTYDQAMDLVGHPGQFEMRIQSNGNESEHILFGNAVSSSGVFSDSTTGQTVYGVNFLLTQEGAQAFHEIASKYDIMNHPEQHEVIMILDNKEFYRAPISTTPNGGLAAELLRGPVNQMQAGTKSQEEANKVHIDMESGALPFNVEVVGSGQVPAAQGAMFKTVVIIAALLAQLAIGLVMYLRYREPRIILPMFLTSLFEIFILLGFASAPFVRWEIDLPSVAAIIAVIGTGIDQLIIITDEVMNTGKVPTTKRIIQKMSQAFKIIFASAATVVVAMVPLYFMGFGSLKGFALTTIVGVAIGIFITRPAYGKIISEILNK